MKKIIVISGKQYSGKDTLCKILLEKMPTFKRIGIADAIKLKYASQKGLTFEEIEENKHLYRKDLIELGNWGRNQDKDYWLLDIIKNDKIIIPDVRVKVEIDFFNSKGAYLIRINSDLSERSKRGQIVEQNDPTETQLDNYSDWNYICSNNSDLENLKQQADKIIVSFNNFIGI